MNNAYCRTALSGLSILLSFSVRAALPDDIGLCAAIRDDGQRLSCYDHAAGRMQPAETRDKELSTAPDRRSNEVVPVRIDSAVPSRLDAHWELTPDQEHGVFHFRPHRTNYLIATYNPEPNEAPYRPFRFLVPESEGLARSELAFQLGFKMKAAQNLGGTPVDVWLGYTQHSFWQISNQEASSPFRETNYQPEVMAVLPLDIGLPGLRLRFLNFGFVHQSNGQASTLSRSWDRIYLQAGLERDNLTLLTRVWKTVGGKSAEDNPDITEFLGRGDVLATYYLNQHELSLLARHNFESGKGAGQLSWAFPLATNLKGYIHYFAGYGYSLIDYNEAQRVLGVGVQVGF